MASGNANAVRQVAHLDIPGGGQVVVKDGYAYVGHMSPPHGTSIIDVRDPANPRVVAKISLPNNLTHTHKVRVVGDLMFTNSEQHRRHFLRKSENIPSVETTLSASLGRQPSEAEVAAELGVEESDMEDLRWALANPYEDGGFRIYDISDKSNPREISFVKTGGVGVHRFACDETYAYISTEMAGYMGNILVVYDIRDPANVREVSRWWEPGQHVEGGEAPTWRGRTVRLHHALRDGDVLWAAYWHGGIRVLDVSDISQPKLIGQYNYHPPFPEPTHTVFKVPHKIDGRDIAVVSDEEHDHIHGQPHGFMWIFDVTDPSNMIPLSTFQVSERDSPWSRAGGRFGLHQAAEVIGPDNLVFSAWFAGGLRVVDINNPSMPREVGFYLPEPDDKREFPQSNDVTLDENGLVYLLDRVNGLDILEFTGRPA